MLKLFTDDNAHGKRLDQWLAQQLALNLSRCCLQRLIRDGKVMVNGKNILEPRFKLERDLKILIDMTSAIEAGPRGENIPLNILYEDEDVIVLNKPAGIVVHPGNGNWSGTLVNALVYYCGDNLSGIGGVRRPGIIHRLDKNTTGVMVVAKNDRSHYHLSRQFADHGRTGVLVRTYIALIWEVPNHGCGKIDLPIVRSNRDRTRQIVARTACLRARQAVTYYTLLEKFSESRDTTGFASLIECQLETGRTHQIRVHMAHVGHPLVGDTAYGSTFKTKVNRLSEPTRTIIGSFQRQALHAHSLTFEHPSTNKVMTFTRDLPNDMQRLINVLRQYKGTD